MKQQNSLEKHPVSFEKNCYCPDGLLKLVEAICLLPVKYVDNSVRGCKTAITKRNTTKEDEQ